MREGEKDKRRIKQYGQNEGDEKRKYRKREKKRRETEKE
jgi:hypothetical protein